MRNGGQWTESRFQSFVKSQLRAGSRKWGPKHEVLRNARLKRGWYQCNGCGEEVPTTLPPEKKGGKRRKNAHVDHIEPVIDPTVGFTNWDDYIERLYCEADNLQVLCESCHKEKTKQERVVATKRRRKEKYDNA